MKNTKNTDNKKTIKNNVPRVHFTASYLLNPVHPVTVALVGAGGSGSAMLSCLASIHCALKGLGRLGLDVTVWDPDTVSPTNIGRQLFTQQEIGLNKAAALVSRFNRCFATEWEAEDRSFVLDDKNVLPNIIITCTDTVSSRKEVGKLIADATVCNIPEDQLYYWMDLGNARNLGQVILGSADIRQPKSKLYKAVSHLPFVTEEFDLDSVNEKDSGPSCSLAEALSKQDLFINRTLASAAGSLLWNLFKGDEANQIRGFYLNLKKMNCVPIHV